MFSRRPLSFLRTAKGRLLAMVLVISLALSLSVGVAYFSAKKNLESETRSNAKALVEVVRFATQNLLHETQTLLFLLEANADVFSAQCHEELRKIIENPSISRLYTGFGVVDVDGQVICSTFGQIVQPLNLAKLGMFQDLLESGGFAIGGVRRGEITGRYVMPAGISTELASGAVAILATALKAAAFQELLDDLPLPDHSAAFIIGHDGKVLAAFHELGSEYWIGKDVAGSKLFSAMHLGHSGTGKGHGFDNVGRLYAYEQLHTGSQHIHLVVTFQTDEVLARFLGDANDAIAISAGVITLTGLLMLVATYLLFVGHLSKLVQTANAIVRGISWSNEPVPEFTKQTGWSQLAEIDKVTRSLQLVRYKLDERTRDLYQTQRIAKICSWKYRNNVEEFSFSDGIEEMFPEHNISGLLAGDFLQYLPDKDQKLLHKCMDDLFAHQTPFVVVVRYFADKRCSNPPRYLELLGELALSPTSSEVSFLGTIQDVTESMRLQKELERSQNFLQAVLDNLGESVIACDVAGRVKVFNKVTGAFYGLPAGQIPIEKASVYHSMFTENGRRQLEPREVPLNRALSGEVFSDERIRIAPYNLPYKIVKVRGQPIYDNGGQIVGAVVVQEDITAALIAESRLKQSEEELRLMFESAIDGLMVVDIAGNILIANKMVAKLHGYHQQEVIGKHVGFLLQDNDWHEFVKTHRNKVFRELESRHKEGRSIPIEVVTSRVIIRGKPAYLAVVRDIRERKVVEERMQALQRLEAVGRLTGGIAHDFNNLLQVILMNLDILEYELEEKKDLQSMAQAALQACAKGGELTRQLLAFTRQQALQVEKANLYQLTVSSRVFLDAVVGKKQHLNISGEADAIWVNLDTAQFQMVLTQLVMNAKDAIGDEGKIHVTVSKVSLLRKQTYGGTELHAGEYSQLIVRDNGSGMDKDTKKRACEPFFTTKKIGQGSGLGLSMVYGFVQQSGGAMEIISALGAGTEIRLYFPLAATNQDVENQK